MSLIVAASLYLCGIHKIYVERLDSLASPLITRLRSTSAGRDCNRLGWACLSHVLVNPGSALSNNVPRGVGWQDGTKRREALLSSLPSIYIFIFFILGLTNVAMRFFLTVPVSRLFHSPTRFCRVECCLVDHAPNRGLKRRHHD
jgi:hypothetical protein